jgi:hypothetical protein
MKKNHLKRFQTKEKGITISLVTKNDQRLHQPNILGNSTRHPFLYFAFPPDLYHISFWFLKS